MNIPARANHSAKRRLIGNSKCELCGYNFWPVLERHHIKPVAEGGMDHEENMVTLCPTCHAVIHHFRSHYELYARCNEGGRSVMWQRNVRWQLQTYADELGLNPDRFIEIIDPTGEKREYDRA